MKEVRSDSLIIREPTDHFNRGLKTAIAVVPQGERPALAGWFLEA
jgi:hypothetical protein